MCRLDNGAPEFSGVGPLAFNPALKLIVDRGAGITRGFGLHSGMLLQLSGAIDPAMLPELLATLGDDSPVQVVNIDPASPENLQRVPVRRLE